MKTDTQRLDFLQRHPWCVVACKATPKDDPRWTAERPLTTRNGFKIFSSLRDAVDYAMTPASGIEPGDLMVGDYCEARIPSNSIPTNTKVRLCRVEETHGHILRVATATRKQLVPINRSQVVGLGWRKA